MRRAFTALEIASSLWPWSRSLMFVQLSLEFTLNRMDTSISPTFCTFLHHSLHSFSRTFSCGWIPILHLLPRLTICFRIHIQAWNVLDIKLCHFQDLLSNSLHLFYSFIKKKEKKKKGLDCVFIEIHPALLSADVNEWAHCSFMVSVNRALLSGEDGSGLRHKMVLQLFRFDDRALLAKTKALLMFTAIYTN